jgi:ssDNA-specific exonuclease RecJ
MNKLNKPHHDELTVQNGDMWRNHFANLYSNITKSPEKNIQGKIKNP